LYDSDLPNSFVKIKVKTQQLHGKATSAIFIRDVTLKIRAKVEHMRKQEAHI